MLLALLAACERPSTGNGPPRVVSATCAADPASAVAATCTVTLSAPAAAEVTLTDGAETVTFVDDEERASHTIPAWGLVADTAWSWTARVAGGEDGPRGELTTGSLPDTVVFDNDVLASDESTLSMVLADASCGAWGFAVVFDAAGRVRWYADLRDPDAPPDVGLAGLHFGDDGSVVALTGGEIVRVDLLGRELLRVHPDQIVHHDVFRRAGLTWTMMAEEWTEDNGIRYVEDVIAAYDDAGEQVVRWAEHDHLDATLIPQGSSSFWADEFPGATDAWHTNGLYVTEDEDLLISLHHVASLIWVAGGEVAWVLGPGTLLPSGFAAVGDGDPWFAEQHHPALLPDGHVTVFDNSGPRGLELAVDPGARTVSHVASWPMPGDCPVQGSVFPLDGDHRLVTCGGERRIAEFDAAGRPIASLGLRCPGGEAPITIRGQPVDLWAQSLGAVRATRN